MELSRRSMLQLGGLGAVAVGGLTLPLSNAVVAKSASLLDPSRLPLPYRRQFALPPVITPTETGEDEFGKFATYVINERPATAQVLPSGQLLHGFGYNGTIPGPTFHVERGVRVVAKRAQPAAGGAPDVRVPVRDVDAPARQPVAARVRRLRQRRHAAGEQQGLPVAHAPDEGPDALVPRPRRPQHRQNVYSGLAGQFHVHDATERAFLPTVAFDIPLTVNDVMFAADGSLGFDDRRPLGPVGRRDPGQRGALARDAGAAAGVPVPDAQRLASPVPTGRRSSRAARCTWSAPTAA